MRLFKGRAMTLVELVLALLLLSVVIMTGISMELGLRRIYSSTDFEAQLMNEAAPILTMVAKSINRGIGSVGNPAFSTPGAGRFQIRIDSDGDGVAEATDTVVEYRLASNELRYYPDASAASFVLLSDRATAFSIGSPTASGFSTIALTLQRIPGGTFNLTNPNITISSSAQFRAYSLS